MIDRQDFIQIECLVNDWNGKEDQRVPADVITIIFNMHNVVFWENREYSKSCGGCRQRVWNKLKTWYFENRDLYRKHYELD